MDTTSLYFEGASGQTLGRRGFSKDHRPDLNQMILAVLLDGDGRPVCTEMWPGSTADVTSLIPAVDRLRKRFSINRVCVVADRGMISAETIAELEARKLLYILGVRERSDKLVRELVLDDPAPFVPFFLTKRKKEIDYEAKAVTLAGRRYIVCRNHEQMRKDAAARAAILAGLERELKKGDKALVGNKGYRRFLRKPDDGHFAIDRAKAEEDAKFDGVFVLRTNARLSPLEANRLIEIVASPWHCPSVPTESPPAASPARVGPVSAARTVTCSPQRHLAARSASMTATRVVASPWLAPRSQRRVRLPLVLSESVQSAQRILAAAGRPVPSWHGTLRPVPRVDDGNSRRRLAVALPLGPD
jgi:hypothetical protein